MSRLSREGWDYLCSFNATYCPFAWFSPWEKLEHKIDMAASMAKLELEEHVRYLHADMRQRFDQIAVEHRLRVECIAVLTCGPERDILLPESPLIGVRSLTGGVSAIAQKDAQTVVQRRLT